MATTKKVLTRNGTPLTAEDWKVARIEPSTLPGELATLYAKVAAANKAVAAAQEAFETATNKALAAKLGKGQKLFFSYRFGRLCILPVDGAPVSAAPAGSLFA